MAASPNWSPFVPNENQILVPLTKGLQCLIDKADAPLVLNRKWKARRGINTWYAQATIYLKGGKYTTIQMHRVILGAGPGGVVDHKDGNGLNNTRENIRICTKQQNNRKRFLRKDSSTGFKGVTRHWNKWRAKILVNSKQRHIGLFDTPELAAAAYDVAAIEEFGREWAILNFPELVPA